MQLSAKAVRRGTPASQLRSSAVDVLGNDSIFAEYYSTTNKSSPPRRLDLSAHNSNMGNIVELTITAEIVDVDRSLKSER